MIEKTTVLVIYIHKRVKSIFFAVPIEFCDELDLAILTKKMFNPFQLQLKVLSLSLST